MREDTSTVGEAGAFSRATAVLSLERAEVLAPNGTPILQGLSFALEAGERVAVLGFNGAGKTSLLLALAGFFPHRGEVRVCGWPLGASTVDRVRRELGMLFADPEDQLLMPRVLEDLLFGLDHGSPGRERRDAALRVLAALGVERLAECFISTLSRGEKTLVALAGALLRRPRLLLLDEPSAALDARARKRVIAVLREQSAAILLATHDLAFARAIASRYIFLDHGTLALAGDDWQKVQALWD